MQSTLILDARVAPAFYLFLKKFDSPLSFSACLLTPPPALLHSSGLLCTAPVWKTAPAAAPHPGERRPRWGQRGEARSFSGPSEAYQQIKRKRKILATSVNSLLLVH